MFYKCLGILFHIKKINEVLEAAPDVLWVKDGGLGLQETDQKKWIESTIGWTQTTAEGTTTNAKMWVKGEALAPGRNKKD